MRSKPCFVAGIVILLFAFVQPLSAQRNPMRFGRISSEEHEMTRYEPDTTAKAVILGDYGVTEIRYTITDGFQYYYTRHYRVKIFDRDAGHLADFRIPLHNGPGSQERLSVLKANVYNTEGGRVQRTSFSRRDSFEEEVSEYLKYVNFALPDVREGSIFEVEYTIISPFLFTLPTWFFQGMYPTVFSEYRIYVPEYFHYKTLMQGFMSLSLHETDRRARNFDVQWVEERPMSSPVRHRAKIDYEENSARYRIDNIPAFTTEPHMNAAINYVARLEHELVTFRWPYGLMRDFSSTWQQLTTRLLDSESFGRLLNRSGFLRDEVQAVVDSVDGQKERMIAAYELVRSQMHWNESNGIYSQRNLRRAWSEKQGNVADINLMLVLLLRELELEADPVILSTRSHGIINPTQIMLDKFNYVIAHVTINGESYLLDATQKHNPWDLLPTRCLNGQGRLISATNGRWVNLEVTDNNLTHTQSEIKIQSCGSIDAKLIRQKTNYHRANLESRYRSYNNEEEFMDAFETSNQGVDLKHFEMQNRQDWSQPLESVYEFDIPALESTTLPVLYIQPLLHDRYTSNPFRLEERQFPVDFIYPYKRSFAITIVVPEGYGIDEMPRNARFSLPRRAAAYQSVYAVDEDGNILVTVEMELRKSVFLANEYQELRSFFARVVEEEARNIVLKKL